MNALVVYESMYGNTRALAEAIAASLSQHGCSATAVSVVEAPDAPDVDLLVVGGPTHMHGLATNMTRKMAAKAGEQAGAAVEPGATAERGLRQWLRGLPHDHAGRAASFDSRGDANAKLTGSACRGIARRLRHAHYDVVASASFLVDDSEGPLAAGEL